MISFAGKHFPRDIILMAERQVKVNHATINRWVVEYSPQLENEFKKKYKNSVNSSWRMDETYLKIKWEDAYLYRAVDKLGSAIDFMLLKKRNKKAAFRFFCKAIGQHGLPEKVTMDKSGANKAGIDKINSLLALLFLFTSIFYQIVVRQIKYLNNIVKQDHCDIKKITRAMLGFKSFASAKATIAGIELHHMKKGQH